MQISRLVSRHVKGCATTASLLALSAFAVIGTARPAQAQMTLTSAGTALGFSLSTFASGFPSDFANIGPFGIVFPTTGGVLVSDSPGNVRLFATDTDGQNAASASIGQFYGLSNSIGLAQVDGNIYMNQFGNGDVVQINPNGTFKQTIISGLFHPDGMVANPANGHLFIANVNNSILDVDPIAKTVTSFVTGTYIDGMSISPDGKTLFGADGQTGHVLGYNILSGAQTFDSGYIPGGIDGTASGYGSLAGNLFVNDNNGTVVELNLATKAQTLIAFGGSRGDFVTVDPTNNTLLLTQSNSIIRLSGGDFGAVPEASTFISTGLLMLGGFGLLWTVRKRTRKA